MVAVRWQPGMQVFFAYRHVRGSRVVGRVLREMDGLVELKAEAETPLRIALENADRLFRVDLKDPATVGCLLAQVREAYGDPKIHVAVDGVGQWGLVSPGGVRGLEDATGFAAEAGALLFALDKAGENG